ncbi:ABCC4 (predicted) [Pycnogonum litorale]
MKTEQVNSKSTFASKSTKKNKIPNKLNALSKIFCWYIIPILKKGKEGTLTTEDIDLKTDELGEINDNAELYEKVIRQQSKNGITVKSLLYSVCIINRFDIIMAFVMVTLHELILRPIFPILLGMLLKQMRKETYDARKEIQLAAGMIFVLLFLPITRNIFLRFAHLTGFKIRYALTSIVYKKVLKLTSDDYTKINTGKLLNLMSSEFKQYEHIIAQIFYIFIGPMQNLIAAVIIWKEIGALAGAGTIIFILVVPIQLVLGRKIVQIRSKVSLLSDERVKLMNDILRGMKVIKMYAWENCFAKAMSNRRIAECLAFKQTMMVRSINLGFLQMTIKIVMLLIISVLMQYEGNMTSDKIYIVLTLMYSLKIGTCLILSNAITGAAVCIASMKRLQSILAIDESKERLSRYSSNGYISSKKSPCIVIKDVFASWNHADNTLANINLQMKKNDFLAIIGSVGSGKTSLLLLILKEIPVKTGFIETVGKIAYVPQEPWVFSDTILNNIIFGNSLDMRKLENVVEACALLQDIMSFPNGYDTLVGERGVLLSGGQKTRVSLARALYHDADIYIFDDPLSSVDSHVGRHIYDECFLKYLKNKIRILVTHQVNFLEEHGNILLLDQGRIKLSGVYRDLLDRNSYYLKNVLNTVGKTVSKTTTTPENHNFTKEMSTNEGNVKDYVVEKESESNTTANYEVYQAYFQALGNWFTIASVIFISSATSLIYVCCDYWLKYWSQQIENNGKNRQNVGVTNTGFYCWHANHTAYTANKSTNLNCLVSSSHTLPTTESGIPNTYQSLSTPVNNSFYFSVYLFLISLTFIMGIIRNLSNTMICLRAARKLHDKIFVRIINVPMRFFNTNPIGRILTRFTSDMYVMDSNIPEYFSDVSNGLSNVVVTLSMVYFENFHMVYVTLFLAMLFSKLAKYYLPTFRAMQRIRSNTSSPIYSHLSASLDGLSTIKAFDATENFERKFNKLQSANMLASYVFWSVDTWFTVYGEIIGALHVILIIILFLTWRKMHTVDSFGFTITQVARITVALPYFIKMCALLQSGFASVERIIEYGDIPSEDSNQKVYVEPEEHENWPKKGKIMFKDLSLKYASHGPTILKNLTFSIESKEKIGVVGRTGSGKTSLINALFRLAEPEGLITIDGLPTSSMKLSDLRRKISVIPQDPILFVGTLKYNLDPFEEFEAQTMWKVLSEVRLEETVTNFPEKLETTISEGGTNFSFGQRQLVCLARAILRKNKILLLDEATSNVDLDTDNIIQETIRKKFEDCTVITIAHRLNTVMDSDRIMVMNNGEIVEFDTPTVLMNDKNSLFYKMVQKTGFSNQILQEFNDEFDYTT